MDKIIVDDEWEWYIGKLFYKIIENRTKPKVVVELAPGFRYKIALALKEIKFNGTLYVIDANQNVISYVENKYREILPNAKIICLCKSFAEAITCLPDKIDLFLSNHAIDDMLIESFLSRTSYNQMFSYNEGSDNYLEAWDKLSQDKGSIKKATDEVYQMFNKLFTQKQVDFVVLSQYRSNLFYLEKDDKIEEIVRPCFEKIKNDFIIDKKLAIKALEYLPFGDDERYLGKDLLLNTQNEKNWIIGKIKN